MSENPVYVIGAGDHGKVVIDALQQAGFTVTEVLDDNSNTWGSTLLGIPVSGPITKLYEIKNASAVVAIGPPNIRQEISENFPEVHWQTVIHPWAYVAPSTKIGPRTVVFAGAVIQPEANIGKHCIINTSASIHHDCHIGGFVHIAPGVHLAGGVKVGNQTFIGIGSASKQYNTIGNNVVVGAGSALISEIPDNLTVAGVPAKIIQKTNAK